MSRERVDDAHVCRLRRRFWEWCAVHGIVLDLFECRCEVVRVAADLRAALIRTVLARVLAVEGIFDAKLVNFDAI